MEPVKCHGNAPSVQLLNEIDILLTQMRLAELYLKQAQAATADQVARVHERYESELENLRAAIRQKERSVNENSLRIAAAEQLHIQIQDLQARLEEHRRLLEQKDGELRGATAKLEASRVQVAQLQSAAEETFTAARDAERRDAQSQTAALQQRIPALQAESRAGLEARVAQLETALADNERVLHERAAVVAAVQSDLQAKLLELENQAAQEQGLLDEREREVAALRTELGEKDRFLAEEQSLVTAQQAERQAETAALNEELARGRDLLESKDHELQRAFGEQSSLRGKIARLEAAARDAELSANRRAEEQRLGFENEFNDLRATLADREHAFAERERDLQFSLERHTAENAGLRGQLADGQSSFEQRAGELQEARSEIAALRERGDQLDLLQKQTERLLAVQGEQIGQRVRAELEDLDARLASKDRELQTDRESAAELQASLNATIGGLRLELAEELDLAEGRDKEIRDLGEKTRGLLEQIAQLESSNLHLQTGAADVVERYHEAHQAELAALQNQLQLRDEALAEQEARGMELERRLGTRIFHLETELAARQRLLEERGEALQTANSSAVALQERLTRLEASSRNAQGARGKDTDLMRATLEAELADLRSELQQKEWAVAQRQALIDNLGLGHKERIRTLETELAELRQAAKNHAMDLDKASSQRQQLLCRIDQLESAAADAEATAISRVEQITHRYEIQMAALDVENEQRTVALEEHRPTRNDLERIYHVELSQLRAESQAKHRLLENRNEEFVAMKNAMDSLRERLTQLESAAAHAEQTGAENRERLRVEYEAQLAALRQELSRREPSDKDQGTMEIAHTKPGQTFYSRSDRRWRSSGGWKRRWKT